MRIVAWLLALLCLAGCAEKNRVPSGIIPQGKMRMILWDMIEADQYSNLYPSKDTAGGKGKIALEKLYQQVFRLHQVSRDDFRKSLQFYLSRPDLTRGLLDSALTLANQERGESAAMGSRIAAPVPAGGKPVAPYRPFSNPALQKGVPPGGHTPQPAGQHPNLPPGPGGHLPPGAPAPAARKSAPGPRRDTSHMHHHVPVRHAPPRHPLD